VLRAVPTEATVAFSLWGSEEQGLIGSRYYVTRLPQSERDRLTGSSRTALLEPPYHSPEGTIAKNISLERLQVSLELIGTATYATAGRRSSRAPG
jgi:Zn-dependent M28 family amino/carboxypeptidase